MGIAGRLARIPKPFLLAIPFFLTAVALLVGAFWGTALLAEFLEENPGASDALTRTVFKDPELLRSMLQICSALFLVLGVCACIRKAWALKLLRGGFFALYASLAVYVYYVVLFTMRLQNAQILIDGEPLTGSAALSWYLHFLWFVLVLAILAAITHLQAIHSGTAHAYGVRVNGPTFGDRIYAAIWNRRARSLAYSVLIHGAIVLVPLLISEFTAGVRPYRVPYGSGVEHAGGGGAEQAVTGPVFVPDQATPIHVNDGDHGTQRPRRHPSRDLRGVIFSPHAGKENSTEHANARIAADLERDMRHDYKPQVAQANVGNPNRPPGPGGNAGVGGPGPGGYPWGSKSAPIRFIRLKYDGEGWDDGMDDSRAELNLLEFLHDDTGFEVSRENEVITIPQLKKFPHDWRPPFVFFKGENHINSVPPADVATLRKYLQEGGMLFADAGSLTWGRDFEHFIAQVLPDYPLLDISDDDELYHFHWDFPNGAPPMWSHAGTRAKGCKINGRWCVFYHPGDVSDGWKTCRDHSVTAMKMGVDVMLYSFKHYGEVTHPEFFQGK